MTQLALAIPLDAAAGSRAPAFGGGTVVPFGLPGRDPGTGGAM